MSDRDEFGAFLVGFIVGGLTGAVVALLFAPQSGEETRALIKDKSIELRDKAQVSAEEAYARAEQLATDARRRSGLPGSIRCRRHRSGRRCPPSRRLPACLLQSYSYRRSLTAGRPPA